MKGKPWDLEWGGLWKTVKGLVEAGRAVGHAPKGQAVNPKLFAVLHELRIYSFDQRVDASGTCPPLRTRSCAIPQSPDQARAGAETPHAWRAGTPKRAKRRSRYRLPTRSCRRWQRAPTCARRGPRSWTCCAGVASLMVGAARLRQVEAEIASYVDLTTRRKRSKVEEARVPTQQPGRENLYDLHRAHPCLHCHPELWAICTWATPPPLPLPPTRSRATSTATWHPTSVAPSSTVPW